MALYLHFCLVLCWSTIISAAPQFQLDFEFGIDERIVNVELSNDGGGNGEFVMYVNSGRTSFVKNRTLMVKPTLSEHLMSDLQATGDLYVAKTRAFINNTAQPWTYDNDYYYGGEFAGRRMVLPYKHVRYQTEQNNTCDDSETVNPDPSTCVNQWEHAYNIMDMNNQAWNSGRWPNARCTHGCIQTAGDYVTEPKGDYTYNMLQPISSARLNTRMGFDMRYGRLEITAKLPKGDWLWPAIWLLPSYPDTYGIWPLSGEIDIMESRGNPGFRCEGGSNSMSSTLHWGPEWDEDAYTKTGTNVRFSKRNSTLTDDFHIYGLIWNETSISTYLDQPDNVILSVDMSDTNFWKFGQQSSQNCAQKDADKGGFSDCEEEVTVPGLNWSNYSNPWASPNNYSEHVAPFDTPFHLIFNVAVGGTNGYFYPGCKGSDGSDIPWNDPDELPIDSFMKEGFRWLPTWVEPENIAWAAHCSLGSAYELCIPSNSACPVKDMTQDGASDKLKSWYESSSSKCTSIKTQSGCQSNSACEWHDRPCPPISDNAALQIKSVVLF